MKILLDEIRLLIADQILKLALWIAPKDHEDGKSMAYCIHAYFRDQLKRAGEK